MRVRGGVGSSGLLEENRLGGVFVGMCRALPGLEEVEIRIECTAGEDEGVLERVKMGYEAFFRERMRMEDVWPSGEVPGWFGPIRFTVSHGKSVSFGGGAVGVILTGDRLFGRRFRPCRWIGGLRAQVLAQGLGVLS